MKNVLYMLVGVRQIEVDYNDLDGTFRVMEVSRIWDSPTNSLKASKMTPQVAAGSPQNPYAAYHCSNCGTPMQAVRGLGIKGLQPSSGGECFKELDKPVSFITAKNDGVCWHGQNHC